MSLAACPAAAESCMPDVYVWAQAGSSCAGCPDVPDVPATLLGIPDHRAPVVSCSAGLLKGKCSSPVPSIAVVEWNMSVHPWAEFGHQGKVAEDSMFCLCDKRG